MSDAKRIAALCRAAAREVAVSPPAAAYAEAAAELLYGTACKESDLRYRRQTTPTFEGKVGAFGLWQVELATAKWLLVDRVQCRAELHRFVFGGDPSVPVDWALRISDERLLGALWRDDRLGAALCRLRYLAAPGALPPAGDREGQARYWLRHYNGMGCTKHHSESACIAQYLKSWEKHRAGWES